MNESNPIKSPKFKIGDKVEVDTKKGTICHVSDFIGAYHVRTEKNGVILAYEENIKKLPKYAVGDVVRFKHKEGANRTVVDKYGLIVTIKSCDPHENICTLYEYPENYTESCFEPFDGFRVGDTVFTLKRGKGKIVRESWFGNKTKRRFFVRFECADFDRNPKLCNLIPTEAKYKYLVEASKKPLVPSAEAWAKVADAFGKAATALEVAANLKKFSDACKKFPSGGVVFSGGTGIDERYCEPSLSKKPTYTITAPGHLEIVDEEGCQKGYRVSKFAVGELVSYAGRIRAVVDAIHWKDGKFTYDLRTNSCPNGVPEDSLIAVPQPRFKVGDVVYFKNIGHSLCATENPNKYIVENPIAAGGYVTLKRWDNKAAATCKESDLRLWKETVLTHCLQSDGVTWSDGGSGGWEKEWYKKIEIMHGYSCGDRAIFLVTTTSGQQAIFKGIKGDDIS